MTPSLAEFGEAAWTARDLYPVLSGAPRGDRAAARRYVVDLYEAGLRTCEVVRVSGYSRSYVRALIRDPDGDQERDRKSRNGGVCADCGAATTGGNGRSAAPRICADCAAAEHHEERYWTRDTIVDALRAAARILGRTPACHEATVAPSVLAHFSPTRVAEIVAFRAEIERRGLRYPSQGVVVREFGSWSAGIDAAGLPRSATGGAGHRDRPGYDPRATSNGNGNGRRPDVRPELDRPAPRRHPSRETKLDAAQEIRASLDWIPEPPPDFADRVRAELSDARDRALSVLRDDP